MSALSCFDSINGWCGVATCDRCSKEHFTCLHTSCSEKATIHLSQRATVIHYQKKAHPTMPGEQPPSFFSLFATPATDVNDEHRQSTAFGENPSPAGEHNLYSFLMSMDYEGLLLRLLSQRVTQSQTIRHYWLTRLFVPSFDNNKGSRSLEVII